MPQTWNEYTLPLQRPRLQPDARPHTVHASSSQTFINEAQDSQQQSQQLHYPQRPSLASLGILPEAAAEQTLSRDDTANDVSELTSPVHAPKLDLRFGIPPEERTVSSFSYEQQEQFVRNAWARFGEFNLSKALPQTRPPALNTRAEAGTSTQTTASLGRRFSRQYKARMDGLKEGVNKMRRQSTPQGIDSGASAPRQVLPVPPTSPSKRNGRHDSDRPFKLNRTNVKSTSELRKDTPAPSTFGLSRPGIVPTGGERARQAAAASKSQLNEAWNAQEDLNARRLRVGSLSTAADSGADLSADCNCVDSPNMDIDGDIEMSMDDEPVNKPVYDPVELLPSEIALQIFRYLDAEELTQAELVSKSWHSLSQDTSVWRNAFLRKYDRRVYTDPPSIQVGGTGCGRPNKPDQKWKEMYKARVALEKNWRAGPKTAGKAVYLSGHTDSVYCVQFDEEKIITGSRDRTIRVWDVNNYTCQRVIGGPNVRPTAGPKVQRTVDYPDFHLATASINGTPYGNSIYHTPSQWHDASILCLQYDEKILVTGSSDSDLLVWDIKTYEPIKRLQRHTGGVLDVALDGKHIVSCSKDSRIIVWDRATYEPRGELTGHRGPVNAVQLRGKYLVSASGDGIARLWDIEQMKLVKEFSAKERGLAAVEFSEDMKHVLAGGNDTVTYKFEVETGKEVGQFRGHTQLVRSLWLDSQNSRVVSGSYDLNLRVYDFNTGEEIWMAEEWTTSWMLAAKSDYRRIVATSQDGRVLIIDFGLIKCKLEDDGQPIPGVGLLGGVETTSVIEWTNPWARQRQRDQEKEQREQERRRRQLGEGVRQTINEIMGI